MMSPHCVFATLKKKRNARDLGLPRKLNGKKLALGFVYSKSIPVVQQKMRKNQNVNRLRFSLNTYQLMYHKIIHIKSPLYGHDPKFLFLH